MKSLAVTFEDADSLPLFQRQMISAWAEGLFLSWSTTMRETAFMGTALESRIAGASIERAQHVAETVRRLGNEETGAEEGYLRVIQAIARRHFPEVRLSMRLVELAEPH